MSEPKTELIDVESVKQAQQTKPPREMSQVAIAAFLYGTLQLLFTVISSGLVLILGQVMKSLQSIVPTAGNGGTDSGDLAEIQKMAEELGITDPSLTATSPPTASPDVPAIPGLTGFTPEASPSQIVPMEFIAILITQGFGLLGLSTSFVSFGAIAKGKSGRGLAITGFASSFLSFVIAFMVALVV